jgi:AcrR family transcriptional regulator
MKKGQVREQILETASRLFYEQGYNATGINQVIDEAGVAKASLYQYFPSKDDLLHEYLSVEASTMLETLRVTLDRQNSVTGKIRALFDFINKRSKETDFQGCNFLNIVAEVPQSNTRIRKVIQKQKNDIRGIIKEILKEVKKEKLADPIYLLFEGALIESKVQQDDWPITTAKNTALQLL